MYCHSVFALQLCWPVKNERDNDIKAAIYHLCVESMGHSLVHEVKNAWSVFFYKNIEYFTNTFQKDQQCLFQQTVVS